MDYHNQENAFIYLDPQKHCKLSYTDFPTIEKIKSGTAIKIGFSRYQERIIPYEVFLDKFLGNENISLKIGVFHLHQNGYGFVEDAFVPPNLAIQLEDGQEVSLIIVKKLDKKKNQLGWSAIASL